MRIRFVRLIAVTAILGIAVSALAQLGHPLKGTWSGDWGPDKTTRTRILLELNWDGKAITGVINPGPGAVPMTKAELDPSTWHVHFEADGKDASGRTVHRVIEGKLENLGVAQRFITGTWVEGSVKGDFKVVRN